MTPGTETRARRDGMAVFSDDMRYRYRLDRDFLGDAPRAVFVMLNPSTADAELDDPTIRRCIGFAKSWGCAGLTVVNLFAYRATDPRELKRVSYPVGLDNERHVKEACEGRPVVCAWGAHGSLFRQDARVLRWLRECGARPHVLKLTAGGMPSHPLYLPATLEAQEWRLTGDA